MKWLNNFSIGIKQFIAPVFLLIVILGMWLSSSLIFSAEKQTLTELETEAFAQASETQRLNVTLTRIHGNIFRMLTWDSNGINAAQVDGLLESLSTDLDQARSHLDAMESSRTDSLNKALITTPPR